MNRLTVRRSVRKADGVGARTFEVAQLERRLLLASAAGRVFYDLNLNGVIDTGDTGLANWAVFADLNNNGQLDGSNTTYVSADTPRPINDLQTTISTINVSGNGGTVAKVEVTLNITHTFTGDLDIFLVAPDGTRVELTTDNGGSGDNYTGTIFDDDATTSITTGTAPFTGRFRPEQPLNLLAGKPIDGAWRLEVYDDANIDTGSLLNWSLNFRDGEISSSTDASGNYTLNGLPAGAVTIRQVPQGGYQSHRVLATVNFANSTSTVSGVNFGNRLPPATISGAVFGDYNFNRARDTGEPGLAGRTVYIDTNNNGQLDAGEFSTVTNASGEYLFIDVAPGAKTVREVVPLGWQQTYPSASGRPAGTVFVNEAPTVDFQIDPNVLNTEYVQNQIVVGFTDVDAFADSLLSRSKRWMRSAINLGGAGLLGEVRGTTLMVLPVSAGHDPAKLRETIISLPGVASADLNYIYTGADPREYTPNDPSFSQQYHHTVMRNPQAWDLSEGSGIKIGVTDDGVAIGHVDLSANVIINPGEIPGNGIDDDGNGYIDDVNGWDFTNSTTLGTGDNNPNPASSGDNHGTHVAGIAAARTNNGVGVAGTAGKATIVPLRFYGTGSWTSTVIFNTYKYAADNGVHIVTTSYNVDGFANDNLYASAVNYLYDNGVLHLNSAGNNNTLNPARQKYETTLYVASTESNDSRSSFSNYGTGIDIAAPGGSIYATSTNNGYATLSGTSMATPNAAAVAALIWSKNPTWTRDQVAAQLLATADNIDTINPAQATLLGTGRVNSFRGVSESIAPPRLRGVEGLPAEGSTVITGPTSFRVRFFNVLDATTANNPANFQLIGAGDDDTFGTADDIVIPISKPAGSTYRIGTNEWTFTIGQTLTEGRYRFVASANLTDPFGQPLDGNGDGTGGDAFTRTFSVTGITVAHSVTAQSNDSLTLDFGVRDRVRPELTSSAFKFDTAHEVAYTFTEAMRLPAVSAFVIRDSRTSAIIPSSNYSVFRDTNDTRLRLVMNTPLPTGDYIIEMIGSAVTDLYGNAVRAIGEPNFSTAITWLAGDMNQDGAVNNLDIPPFVQGLTDPSAFTTAFGYGPGVLGDINRDGAFNNLDIAGFVSLLTGGRSPAPAPAVAPSRLPVRAPGPVGGGLFSDEPLVAGGRTAGAVLA